MLAKELMTTHVSCVEPAASIFEAAEMMKRVNVGALPVCEKGKTVGVVTDRDITIRATAEGGHPDRVTVSDAMSREVAFCQEDDSIETVAQLMEKRKIRRVLVEDSRGSLKGIITVGDLVRSAETEMAVEVLEYITGR